MMSSPSIAVFGDSLSLRSSSVGRWEFVELFANWPHSSDGSGERSGCGELCIRWIAAEPRASGHAGHYVGKYPESR